jgi:hypothetical protein
MYTSTDEARSDLILAGAAYLFGPLLLGFLLGWIPGIQQPLYVLQPLIVTLLVPILLMRYRREPAAMYGLTRPSAAAVGLGLATAVPVAVAVWVSDLLGAGLFSIPRAFGLNPGLVVAHRLAVWIGLAGLATYAVVKARDAFAGNPRTLREAIRDVGRVLAIVAVGATVLLLLGLLARGQPPVIDLLLLPLGVAGAVLLTARSLRGPSTSQRAALVVPLVLLALRPFLLTFDALMFVQGVWHASLLGGIGLAMAVLMQSRGTAWGPLTLGFVLAVLTGL